MLIRMPRFPKRAALALVLACAVLPVNASRANEACGRRCAEIDLAQTADELAKQLQELYVRVHAAMPMEQAADAKAEAVLAELQRCCIAPDGRPIQR